MPSFSVLRSLEVFLFSKPSTSRWSLNRKTVRVKIIFARTKLKDQFMKKNQFVSLALAGLFSFPQLPARSLPTRWFPILEGSGVTSGYNDPTAALGAPTIYIGYQNADPFNPPYQSSDIVGIGTGGSLTLQFNTPIQNNPGNPFGLDFIIFGHAGFNITNWRLQRRRHHRRLVFHRRHERCARVRERGRLDILYVESVAHAAWWTVCIPTDAGGNPFLPVNPSLTAADFTRTDPCANRSALQRLGGRRGFDIGWAVNGSDQSVSLPSIDYIRLDVLNDGTPAYIDAISVVPEPTTFALAITGAGLFSVFADA